MPEKVANVQIEASWKAVLAEEFEKPYFAVIKEYLVQARQSGKTVFPPGPLIFNAFNQTPFEAVKVVIIGQDPYHNPGEAMGLSFSVPQGVRIPPSLANIYKELHSDLGVPIPKHGDLTHWAQQGVLLLNAILTVEARQAASHQKIGWQTFTDAVIRHLSEQRTGLVFLLWGKFAQSKKALIDETKHTVLEAAHPSPLARDAFSGNRHFSKTNEILQQEGLEPIDWEL
ncbi:MAG: uracil-DNA glycosylase [Saprospiraceae bacterium]